MLLKDISDMEKRIHNLRKEKKKMILDYAREHAPYAIGDIIPITGMLGWTYKGKEMKIDKITLSDSYWRNEYHWFIHGHVMNKDGKPGKNETYFHIPVTEVGR